MWSDIETKRDYLNYMEVAEGVSEILLTQAMRPVSIGIFGTWGTGKSSLLNLIEVKLNETATNDIIVIRFDAWLYQGYDDARAALMDVIAHRLYEAAEGQEGALDIAKRFLARVRSLRALGFGIEVFAAAHGLPMFGAGAKAVRGLEGIINGEPTQDGIKAVADGGKTAAELVGPNDTKSPPQQIEAFRAEFDSLLKSLKKTMVVFVDNLDRCLPTQTIHTLEALRLFLFMDQSAFVIAADEDMVRGAVSKHFGGASQRHITDYLDKLIQIPVRVPRLGVAEIRAYLFLLFAEAARVDLGRLSALQAALEENLRLSWKQSPIAVEGIIETLGGASPELRRSLEVADRIAHLLATSTYVQGNPRIVKRLLNVVRLRTRIANRRQIPVDEEMVAKFALFERCVSPQAVDKLYALINESSGGKPQVLADLEGVVEDPTKFEAGCPTEWKENLDFMHEWIGLKPHLAGVDLRPLIYLSRETSTLRTQSLDLSQAAAQAVVQLSRVRTVSSPLARMAIAATPASELGGVMRELIAMLRLHADWTNKPEGFNGALVLADHDSDSGSQLSAYLHSLPEPRPPWLMAAVRERSWFKEGK
jgi:predicted KAP-like P-loop ATPase